MSRIIAGTVFVLLSGATVTGGILLHKGSKSNQNIGEEKATTTTYDSELPDSLNTFKSQGQTEGCLTTLFPGLEKTDGTGATDATSSSDLPEDFFPKDVSKSTSGCLVANWDKQNYTGTPEKWKGTFRFLWAAKGGNDKGFLVFLLGIPSNDGTNKKVAWSGVSYTLEYEGTAPNKKWTPKKKHEIPTSETKAFKKEDSTDDAKFPQPGETLTDVTGKTFWGWFGASADMENICEESSGCTGTPKTSSMKGYWEWTGNYGESPASGQKKLSDWTKGLDTWWPEIFGNNFQVKNVADKQIGTWTQRAYKVEPRST